MECDSQCAFLNADDHRVVVAFDCTLLQSLVHRSVVLENYLYSSHHLEEAPDQETAVPVGIVGMEVHEMAFCLGEDAKDAISGHFVGSFDSNSAAFDDQDDCGHFVVG